MAFKACSDRFGVSVPVQGEDVFEFKVHVKKLERRNQNQDPKAQTTKQGECTHIVQRSLKTPRFHGDYIGFCRDVVGGCCRSDKQQPDGNPCSAQARKRPHLSCTITKPNACIHVVRKKNEGAPRQKLDGGYLLRFLEKTLFHRVWFAIPSSAWIHHYVDGMHCGK